MNKSELRQAFSNIHASDDLMKEVLGMKKKRVNTRMLMIAACIAVVGLISVILMGLENTDPEATRPEDVPTAQIDWTLYAVWVDSEGNVVKGENTDENMLTFTFQGIIYENGELVNRPEMEFRLTFQDEFRYLIEMPSTRSMLYPPHLHDKPYYVNIGYVWDQHDGGFDAVFSYWALSLEKEWMIFDFDNADSPYQDPGTYLIAFRDPNADPKEIMEYYQGFLESYSFDGPHLPPPGIYEGIKNK